MGPNNKGTKEKQGKRALSLAGTEEGGLRGALQNEPRRGVDAETTLKSTEFDDLGMEKLHGPLLPLQVKQTIWQCITS